MGMANKRTVPPVKDYFIVMYATEPSTWKGEEAS